MKRILSMLLVLAMIFGLSSLAYASNLAIQLIDPDTSVGSGSLDNVQLGQTYTIDGYAKVKPVEFNFYNFYAQFNKDADYYSLYWNESSSQSQVFVNHEKDWYNCSRWRDAYWNDSGLNAEFAWFQVDLTNLQKKSVGFTEDVSVTYIYQDEYEFTGWVRQINYDYLNYKVREISRYNASTAYPNVVVLDPANDEDIDMMYTGTYVFGALLPNSVVEDTKSSLQIVITIDGNEIIYNARK